MRFAGASSIKSSLLNLYVSLRTLTVFKINKKKIKVALSNGFLQRRRTMKKFILSVLSLVCVQMLDPVAVHAQSVWTPSQNVEIIVPAGPGGANDLTGRLVQRILQDGKLVNQSISVVNRPGGGHSIGLAYLNRREGDGHSLMVETMTMLVNALTGKLKVRHTDVTPLAVLYKDYIAVTVPKDSPIKNGRDFIERLKTDPASLSIAISSAIANSNHLAIGLVARNAGADVRKMKIVVFNSGQETMTALLGGHVDAVAGPATVAAQHLINGKVRVVGITAPRRMSGPMAEVPTFGEQGSPAVMANWRSIVGPKGMTPQQIAYWDQVLAKMVETDAYKKEVERNLSDPDYMRAAEARKYWDEQYAEIGSLLNALGLSGK